MSLTLTSARDAAIRALCDFAEQPHPGRAGEAIDALERHLRASRPATETADPKGAGRWESRWVCPQCGAGVSADEDGCCATCGATCCAETRHVVIGHSRPAPQPVEGVSDEELNEVCTRAFEGEPNVNKQDAACNRALFNLGASRSSAAKDARIEELKKALLAVVPLARGYGNDVKLDAILDAMSAGILRDREPTP